MSMINILLEFPIRFEFKKTYPTVESQDAYHLWVHFLCQYVILSSKKPWNIVLLSTQI